MSEFRIPEDFKGPSSNSRTGKSNIFSKVGDYNMKRFEHKKIISFKT